MEGILQIEELCQGIPLQTPIFLPPASLQMFQPFLQNSCESFLEMWLADILFLNAIWHCLYSTQTNNRNHL